MADPREVAADEVVVDRLRAAGCVFAEEEATLLLEAAGADHALLDRLVSRRVEGVPLEHVLGWAELCGHRYRVDPGVFVPRRRSELLVDEAANLGSAVSVVVDLCCGTGAVGAAVVRRLGGGELHAADLDPAAVRCARANVGPLGGTAYESDLDEALPLHLLGRVDLLVANAPYVPTAEIALLPREARSYESITTLDGGADGVDLHRRIAATAARWLSPAGHLLIETGEHQTALTAAAVTSGGLHAWVVVSDDLGSAVVVGSRTPAP